MTTTDPTITIAGLRAQVESLETSLRAALDDGATSEEVRLIAAAENACLTAERDALAAQLAEVRAELSSDATKRDGRISAICRALDIDDDRDVVDAIDEMRSRHANDLASERAHLAAGRTRIAGLEQAANERSAEVARLTARVAELEARPVNARAALIGVLTATKHGPGGRGGPGDCDADCVKCEADRALATLGAPPTSPPAARPVFAGVSASDLDVAYIGGQRECHRRHEGAIKDCCRYAAVAAVLARLDATLVAPVDPEAVALRLRDHAREIGLHPQREPADYLDSLAALVRVIFTAAGIPVAPEVRK